MSAPTPYLFLPGTAREALETWATVFGGRVELMTLADAGREDGRPDAVAHGGLVDGPVALFAADAGDGGTGLRTRGLMMALLGTAEPAVLRGWFDALAEGGRVVEPLERRPWGASDGQVVDRFGVHWLVGFEGEEDSAPAGA